MHESLLLHNSLLILNRNSPVDNDCAKVRNSAYSCFFFLNCLLRKLYCWFLLIPKKNHILATVTIILARITIFWPFILATAYQVTTILLMWESVTFHFNYVVKSNPVVVCQREKVKINREKNI